MSESPAAASSTPHIGPGIWSNFRFDFVSGFLVFLIAMPLCLAISRASGYPPIAGIWTAILGGIICGFISNSEMTIKGPAAGLIVIAVGAVTQLGKEFAEPGMTEAEQMALGYHLALGVGVAAGILQVLLGLLRAGRLVDFFPLTPVHGMLSSIGIIIIAKNAWEVLGVRPEAGGPLKLLYEIPGALFHMHLNPEILIIGTVSLMILFGLPLIKNRWVRMVPSQLIVLVIAIGLGFYFDLHHTHTYLFPADLLHPDELIEYEIGESFLVNMPNVLTDPSSAFAFPDFRGLATATGLQYVFLFMMIGSLESVLSAKAIDLLDPWRRKTNFDRDLIAVGLANTVAAFVGGLPMISEIVRSSANINNGARTRFANFWHGAFLLAFVLLAPGLIHSIPNAALGAMLIYTGFRLASPKEFLSTWRVGLGQFTVFLATIIATLVEDLLVGIAVGIVLEVVFNVWHGGPLLNSFFRSKVSVQEPVPVPDGAFQEGAPGAPDDKAVVLKVQSPAVFSNWLSVRGAILANVKDREGVVIDFSESCLVDHSVMEKLHELERELTESGKYLKMIGMDAMTPLSSHPLAARKKKLEEVAEVVTTAS